MSSKSNETSVPPDVNIDEALAAVRSRAAAPEQPPSKPARRKQPNDEEGQTILRLNPVTVQPKKQVNARVNPTIAQWLKLESFQKSWGGGRPVTIDFLVEVAVEQLTKLPDEDRDRIYKQKRIQIEEAA